MERSLQRMDCFLLQGCYFEAARAEGVSVGLEGLQTAPSELRCDPIRVLITQTRTCARLLRYLADISQIYSNRTLFLLNYLQVLLPCLSRTLRNMMHYFHDFTAAVDMRWWNMFHDMTREAGGLPLPQRFSLYNHFLRCLKRFLVMSPKFDFNSLESSRTRIMVMRQARGLCKLLQNGPFLQMGTGSIPMVQDPMMHWAQDIFSRHWPCRTALGYKRGSTVHDTLVPFGRLNLPEESLVLFRSTFDKDHLALVFYLDLVNNTVYILLRKSYLGFPYFSLRGVHELFIKRRGSCLELIRWSISEYTPKTWASLCFKTYEELSLFHCTFVSLRARSIMTMNMHPREFRLAEETNIFQAQIIDQGFEHSLVVYQDVATQALRLQAAVWDPVELRRCPVWTTFITHQYGSPTWLRQKSRHRVLVRDVQLYVFCDDYPPQKLRKGETATFEIYFLFECDATYFRQAFTLPRR